MSGENKLIQRDQTDLSSLSERFEVILGFSPILMCLHLFVELTRRKQRRQIAKIRSSVSQ